MDPIEILLSNAEGFTFSQRSDPLAPDLRLHWKVPMLLFILSFCRGKKSSFKMLHVLNWVIKTPENQNRFFSYVTGEESNNIIVARFEPSMNLALDFAKGEGLVEFIGGKSVKLTGKGLAVAKSIYSDKECFIEERNFLTKIKPFMKENKIDSLFGGDNR